VHGAGSAFFLPENMASQIPNTIQAGDSYEWTESESLYPAPTYTLTAYLVGNVTLTLTGVGSGSEHVFSLTVADSKKLIPGLYEYQVRASDGTDAVTLYRGKLTVLQNLATTAAGYDARSHARRTLEGIEAALEGRLTKEHSQLTIGGRSISLLSPEELIKAKSYYDMLVKREEDAENISKGLQGKSRILTRFV
jgi:hypothetical protein